MENPVCEACGYVYSTVSIDPQSLVKPDTKLENLPEEWTCPSCGIEKNDLADFQ